jgi:flagellin
MGFRINTNIAAMNAHTNATMVNRGLDNSLEKLSSGLRINKAADDASGMAIADSLRSQASSLGQAIANANDAMSIIQIADKAMDEQLKILDTIKTKSIQAATDGQSAASREAIQKDVNRLLESLDNIAKTTAFNGQQLLSGTFSNKEFQIGAYSNETVKASIENTQSLAIGNTSQKTDLVQIGNNISETTEGAITKGTNTLTIANILSATTLDVSGLAQGDTIRIDGVGDYTITNINGTISDASTFSAATITLDRGIEKTLSAGSTFNMSLINTADEDLNSLSGFAIGAAADTVTVDSSDISGFAIGDTFDLTTSLGETKTYTVTGIAGSSTGATSGSITFSSTGTVGTAGTLSDSGSIAVNDRSSLGTDFAAADYVQYTVEGTQLQGVQLTDDNGNGVAQTGLGRVADLINATSDQTGVKAVADVSVNSLITVQGGLTNSDIVINGETILGSGTNIVNGDSDNVLINAINEKSQLTGVSASLEADGTMTLTSDGRAMKVSGLSGVAGINDGVHAGTLELVKQGGGDIDVTSAHFQDEGLVASAQADVKTMDEIEETSVLSDVQYGQVDDNGDGVINSDDKVGLLNTREGATKAMDIVESAISKLDSVRADLGSVQNQLVSTVSNISVTQVNVKAAESQIRDVDFAAESANFSRLNILAQSGSYAMSQANAVQQNVLRLLQ